MTEGSQKHGAGKSANDSTLFTQSEHAMADDIHVSEQRKYFHALMKYKPRATINTVIDVI